ncbi:MAG: restriction endonuclease subunit S [Labilibaculum antarcticum]
MVKKYTNNYRLDIAYNTIFRNINAVEEIPIHNVLNITSGDNLTKNGMVAGSHIVYGGGGDTGNTHFKYNIDYKTIGIGRVGARCGCVFEISPNSWVTDNALLIQSYDKRFSLDFLRHFLSYSDFGQYANNAMQPVISKTRIKDVTIPLVDIEEQNALSKILDSIEKNEKFENTNYNLLISKIGIIDNWETLNEEIEIQKQLLSQLRQSILQEAIQGKLTADWREHNPNTEPASELLKRIKADKDKLIKVKKNQKGKVLSLITKEEIPFELPDGWLWSKLGNICSKTGSGSTPRGGKSAYKESGVKFIRSQNVYDDGLRINGVAFIPQATHDKMNGTKVQAEDLLLNITGGSIGRCCIVPKDFDTGNINQHVAIIRSVILETGYYLHRIICSPYFQNMIIEVQTGAGREGLPKNKMDNILIPLPPLEEQKAIVKKVETLMQKCQALEQEIKTSEANAKKLMQAVLKEAFESKEEALVKVE